ncbi:hypothetical protein [Sphingomonas sp. 3-13AW]|uniref:hypothetical protein n=1 Tax=Sphingomonas sp. 3-13AW TaxID=3050450 RepID=UPI003BB5A8CD
MRTLEEYAVELPPVASAAIDRTAGQALIHCPDDGSDMLVRDYLFTPFGLTATLRFDPNGSIASKKLSAGSWHDLFNAAIDVIATRAGIDPNGEADWIRIATLVSEWHSVLDDPALIDDLASERIFVIPGLENNPCLLENVLAGTVTATQARAAALNPNDFENDKILRTLGVVLDDTWSLDENELDAAIAKAATEHEIVLFGILDGDSQFLHTIGLSELKWPEIMVRNLDPHLSPFLLRTIVGMHEFAGIAPSPGRIPETIMPGGLRLKALASPAVQEVSPRADCGCGTLEVVFPL